MIIKAVSLFVPKSDVKKKSEKASSSIINWVCAYIDIVSNIKEWFSTAVLGILTKYLEVILNLKSYSYDKNMKVKSKTQDYEKSRVGERFKSIKHSDISHKP